MTLLVDTTVRRPSEAELTRVQAACAVMSCHARVNFHKAQVAARAVGVVRAGGVVSLPGVIADILADLSVIHEDASGGDDTSDALRATAAYLRNLEASGESRGEYGAAPGASTTRQQDGQTTPAPPAGTRAVRPAVVHTPAAANAGQATGGGTTLPRVLRRWPLLAALLGLLGGCAPFGYQPPPFYPVCDCRAETAHVAQVADVALRELEACRAGAPGVPRP